MRRPLDLLLVLGLIVGLFGCVASGTPPSPEPSPGSTPVDLTAGTLASAGQDVYSLSCAGCHGRTGTGVPAPALVGTSAKLAKFGTAQGLLEYISKTMPANRPGDLSADEYLQVLSWVLVQNNTVPTSAYLDPEALDRIPLK